MAVPALRNCYWAGLGMIAAGVLWSVAAGPGYDTHFVPGVRKPRYLHENWRRRPLMFIDEAHSNAYTIDRSFLPFAELAREDGYQVRPNRRRFSAEVLRRVPVLVVTRADGYSGEELAAVRDWVRDGGGLLVAGDAKMAATFNVGVNDSGHSGRLELVSHEVTDSVSKVTTYDGGVLRPPQGAVVILRLADGQAKGLLLQPGKGRVAVFTEASMLTARISGGMPIGINDRRNDNQRLVLNVLHWLTRR